MVTRLRSNIDSRHKIRIAYDASRSVLTIFPMPSPIHGGLQAWAYGAAVLSTNALPHAVRKNCFLEAASDINGFEGDYQGSTKIPDISISWKDDDGWCKRHTVVEIGLSQTVESLYEARDLYLTGTRDIQRVVRVKVNETPKFDLAQLMNIDSERLEDHLRDDCKLDSYKGPMHCQNIPYVGALEISWEVWERDPNTEKAAMVYSKDIIPIPEDHEVELPFFETPTEIAAGIDPVTIKLADIEDLLFNRLPVHIRQQGKDRITQAKTSKNEG